MSYIDRNELGQIVGLFANAQYEGQEYLDGAEMYVPPPPLPTPLEQIRALEAAKADASAKVVRQTLLRAAVEKAMERPEVVAMLQDYPAEEVKAQVISTLVESDPGFKLMWELEQAVKPLRAQIT
jgi:hypothetical protein